MYSLAILSGLIAASSALPLAPKAPANHGGQVLDNNVARMAGGALAVTGIGAALYGAHQTGKKSAEQEFRSKTKGERLQEYLRGYKSGRIEERLRFLGVVDLVNECIDNLRKVTFRLDNETEAEYRTRLEGICRGQYPLKDHPLERYMIPQPITPQAEEQPSNDHVSPSPETWLSKLGGVLRKVGATSQAAQPVLPVGARILALP
ncbi:MAG: hypothetical protein M1816_004412 [Peltula sp. TS41687]|nr:MAG: hypothetical protein M1816_004412 [Peltula sp. TS41687]